ncbi:MAG TPA: PepSY-associated TM helix domain-containing protein [Croceibacterium sp.]|nr:PepSY-associated TM helix domain-containing protein [Croceibacterium sp.]
MNVAPGTSTVKNSLSAHAAVGLLAGALLYIVALSGTLLVFYDELQRAEQPGIEMTAIEPAAIERAAASIMAREAGKPRTTHLYFNLPSPEFPRAIGYTDTQEVRIASDGRVADELETHWSEFLYAIHYALTLPGAIGIIVVGILGVMMMTLSLSGVIAHPRIFRDAFRLRARDGGGVGLTDWHNRLSVWTLPFIVMIALTGAVIGLGALTIEGVAARYYGGDTGEAYAPVFGGEHPVNLAPAGRLPAIARSLDYMRAHYPGVEVTFLTIHDPLTKGQSIQIMGEHPRRLIFGEYYNFDADGNFENAAGLADGELGQQAAASNYNLHFGNYGGLTVKIAYFLLGLALTAICATGTFIWLGKRRRRGIVEPRLRAAWHGVVWGTPAALAVTFIARFAIGNGAPFVAIFWATLAAAVIGAVWSVTRSEPGPQPQPAE